MSCYGNYSDTLSLQTSSTSSSQVLAPEPEIEPNTAGRTTHTALEADLQSRSRTKPTSYRQKCDTLNRSCSSYWHIYRYTQNQRD
jgi:hypothetical protein